MKPIIDGIVAKVETSNTFNTAIGGRFYYDEAPQSVTFPYAVMFTLDMDFSWTFDSNIKNNLVQIRCISKTRDAAEIEDIRTKLLELFDYKTTTLTVTGYSFIFMKQISEDGPTRIDNAWNYNVRYEVEIEKSD
ncbi:MAG TPA: hypothetical protein ENH82_12355 [bacterium]|nr:hypothetical protein [bacterium]